MNEKTAELYNAAYLNSLSKYPNNISFYISKSRIWIQLSSWYSVDYRGYVYCYIHVLLGKSWMISVGYYRMLLSIM